MKKATAAAAVLFLSLLLCACGGAAPGEETTGGEQTGAAPQSEETTADAAETHDETTEDAIGGQDETTGNAEERTTEKKNSPSDHGISRGRKSGTDKTFTGLEPLKKKAFKLSDTSGLDGLSKDRIEHGFGAAENGKPNPISVNNQKFMDEHGFNALCYDNQTKEKVLYLTFDVGYENGYTLKVLDVLKEKKVPAAFFCTQPELEENSEAIARMIDEGHIVGNHSVNHPDFSSLSQERILSELQGFDDYIREHFGYSSMYFRYPQGKYSEYSQEILTRLGFTSVFWSIAYADWDVENQPSRSEAFETVVSRLHPGAVILLHAVAPVNYEILPDFIDEARAQGYEFVPLTYYSAE